MVDYRRCSRCGEPAYAHIDHEHIGVKGTWPGTCPFGDCGEFLHDG